MTRRALLAMLAAAAAAALADPERLVWVPGRKLISIPAPAPVHMFNVFRYTVPPFPASSTLIATFHRNYQDQLVAAIRDDVCSCADYEAIRDTIPHLRGPRSGHARLDPDCFRMWDTVPVGCPSMPFRLDPRAFRYSLSRSS